jgi:leucyl aminopeptidase
MPHGALDALDTDALLLIATDPPPAEWADSFGELIGAAVSDAKATGGAVSVLRTGSPGPRRLIVSVPADTSPDASRAAAAAAVRTALALQVPRAALALPEDPHAAAALVEGARLGAYRFDRYRSNPAPALDLTYQTGPRTAALDEAVARAEIRAAATNRARDLVNWSPDEKTPDLLAQRMRGEAEQAGIGVSIWDEARIRDEGMGGLLGVNRGSLDPARFVVLEWTPDGTAGSPPVVLVGKTVVFDTGGLSLKPTKDSMDKMKADMAGGAAVFGAMLGAARLNLPQRIVGLLPMSDNRPGGRAFVPGDILRMHGGTTVEVLNTDAEGRLLLADALSYARSLHPRLVVDVATLTGAQGVALGERVAALVVRTGDDALADGLRQAGEETGDLVWLLPLFPHYHDQLSSDVADLKNVGGAMAGTITAAAFLEHFTRSADGQPAYPWAHLDIARPAFLDAPYTYRPKGGTGFGVRLLLSFLERLAD